MVFVILKCYDNCKTNYKGLLSALNQFTYLFNLYMKTERKKTVSPYLAKLSYL